MVNQQYNGYDSAEQEELRGALVYGEEPVKGDRHGRCTGKNKVLRGIMYVSFIRTSETYVTDCKTIGQLWWGLFVWKVIIKNARGPRDVDPWPEVGGGGGTGRA